MCGSRRFESDALEPTLLFTYMYHGCRSPFDWLLWFIFFFFYLFVCQYFAFLIVNCFCICWLFYLVPLPSLFVLSCLAHFLLFPVYLSGTFSVRDRRKKKVTWKEGKYAAQLILIENIACLAHGKCFILLLLFISATTHNYSKEEFALITLPFAFTLIIFTKDEKQLHFLYQHK